VVGAIGNVLRTKIVFIKPSHRMHWCKRGFISYDAALHIVLNKLCEAVMNQLKRSRKDRKGEWGKKIEIIRCKSEWLS
jgi:hypothetical protein